MIKTRAITLAIVAVGVLATGSSAEVGAKDVGGSRDLFDQMVQSLAHKWMPGYRGDGLQWSVHPLPRKEKRQNSAATPMVLQPDAGDDDGPASGALAGLFGGTGSASVLAASPSRSAAQASATDASSASATASSAVSSAVPSSSADRSATSSPATSSVPTAPAFSFSTPTPSSSSSITSTASARPTMSAQRDDDGPTPSLLSPKHKFFPLVVAGLAAAGLLALMLLIAIARAVAHDQLRRDKLKQSYGFDEYTDKPSKSGDKFTSNPGVGAARSLRRAMTRKKLGSFARRTADGSVLIEVGDEVFAVPPHLADSYRDRILREKRSRSDLSQDGGLFGSVKPRHLNDGGPDADEGIARAAYDTMMQGEQRPSRSLSQRLTDRFKAITTSPRPTGAYSFDARERNPRQVDLAKPALTKGAAEWTIQPQAQAQPEYGTARVVERTSARPPPRETSKPIARKAPPKLELSTLTAKLQDLEKQSSCSSSRLPAETSISRSSASSTSANGTFGGSRDGSDLEANLPGAFPERTKSLARARSVKPLILSTDRVGGYRHRHADTTRSQTQVRQSKPLQRKSTVALASPTRFHHEKSPGLVVHPEKPQAAFRPLPVPPPFTLPK